MMRYNHIKGIEKPIARLVQGTVMLNNDTREKNLKLLDAVYEQGFTTFDTAHGYGRGSAEKELGAWMNSRGLRDEVVIITKGAHPYPPEEPQRVRPEFIRRDLQESLDRLGTDYVEIYLLHRDDASFPVDEIVDVLDEAKQKGQIGCYGGSNWTAERVRQANEYARANNRAPFTVTSPQFSVAEMIEAPWAGCISVSGAQGESSRAYYRDNDIALITWSSLAGGFMTGKFTRDNLDSFTNGWDTVSIKGYAYESNFQRLDRVMELAKEKGASPAQISLAYSMSVPDNVFAVIANWEIEQIADNLKSLDINLSPEEIAWLEMKTEEKPV